MRRRSRLPKLARGRFQDVSVRGKRNSEKSVIFTNIAKDFSVEIELKESDCTVSGTLLNFIENCCGTPAISRKVSPRLVLQILCMDHVGKIRHQKDGKESRARRASQS